MVGNATDFFTVALPKDRPLIYYLTATDERGATVSSEHVVAEKKVAEAECKRRRPERA
jgi:hypothetical protein